MKLSLFSSFVAALPLVVSAPALADPSVVAAMSAESAAQESGEAPDVSHPPTEAEVAAAVRALREMHARGEFRVLSTPSELAQIALTGAEISATVAAGGYVLWVGSVAASQVPWVTLAILVKSGAYMQIVRFAERTGNQRLMWYMGVTFPLKAGFFPLSFLQRTYFLVPTAKFAAGMATGFGAAFLALDALAGASSANEGEFKSMYFGTIGGLRAFFAEDEETLLRHALSDPAFAAHAMSLAEVIRNSERILRAADEQDE